MYAVTVTYPAWEGARRFGFAGLRLTIGKGADCGLILVDADIAAAHAGFQIANGQMSVAALGDSAVYVNDEQVAARAITPADRVRIGAYGLRFELVELTPLPLSLSRYQAANDTEAALLVALAKHDDASRAVYADWLDEQGDAARAEYLRLQHVLRRPTSPAQRLRLAALAAEVDPAWKLRVAQPPVEYCEVFRGQCTKDWSELEATDQADVRHCRGCGEDVYYATSVAEARDHALGNRCVALDAAAVRWANDLDAPFGERTCDHCGCDLASGVGNHCPYCDQLWQPPLRAMRLGRIAPKRR